MSATYMYNKIQSLNPATIRTIAKNIHDARIARILQKAKIATISSEDLKNM